MCKFWYLNIQSYDNIAIKKMTLVKMLKIDLKHIKNGLHNSKQFLWI